MTYPLTLDDFVDLWRRVLDPGYTGPIEAGGSGRGLELVRAHAAIAERLSLAVDRTAGALYILPHSGQTSEPASGAHYSAVELEFRRSRAFQVPVKLTTSVEFEDADGRRFRLDSDLDVPAGSPGPWTAAASAEVASRSWDVRAGTLESIVQPGSTFANLGATVAIVAGVEELTDTGRPDALTPAHVGQYVQFTVGANVGRVRRVAEWRRNVDGTNTVALANDDPSIPAALAAEAGAAGWRVLRWAEDLGVAVTNPEAASGGSPATLDELGAERRTPRSPGEGDEAYRLRVATLPDVVSPNAVRRSGNRVLAPIGEKVVIREVGRAGFPGFFWDLDAWDYDDVVRPADRFKLWLDLVEMRGFFLVGVPERTDGEFGFFYDEGFVDAYDASPDLAFYDGFPASYWLGYVAALRNQIDLARAGGVGFELYRVRADDPPEE